MNKQELIERLKNLPFLYIHNEPYLNKEAVLEFVKHLDEPKTGHAAEAPRYVKNILERLRELPLHDREVWLKVIISEFKQDFSHAKWREGYEQGKFDGMLERDKVTIPQFVADWIERSKQEKRNLRNALNNGGEKMRLWFLDQENYDLFARAWLEGYEVEKETRYRVKMKNIIIDSAYLKHQLQDNHWYWGSLTESNAFSVSHAKKELEDADFSWVFDCEGVEIEEVKDE